MGHFVKIGKRRINLEMVRLVVEEDDQAIAFFSGQEKADFYGEVVADVEAFGGDEAKLLLAYVDGDYEQVDALDSLLNAPKTEQPEVIQTDEEIAAADRDETPYYNF